MIHRLLGTAPYSEQNVRGNLFQVAKCCIAGVTIRGDANDDNSGGSVRGNVRYDAELIGRDDRFLADP